MPHEPLNAESSENAEHEIDRICHQFKAAWRAGSGLAIEEFLRRAAEPHKAKLLCELLRLDVEYRRRYGRELSVQNYLSRFPAHQGLIRSVLMGADEGSVKTIAYNRGQTANARALLEQGMEVLPSYRLMDRLGRGGFGEVWKAIGPGGVPVAMKFLPCDQRAAEIESRALEFMKYVHHPHLLTTFGIWHTDNLLIIGMELAERTLLERLREAIAQGHPGIPFVELLEYMREAAKGIDFLNESRHAIDGQSCCIIHRDIKPQNLLLVGGGVKVADFGLARTLERSMMTKAGGMTPAYAAPEFFEGRVSSSSDQYSLAATYCELRTGRLPFQGNPLQIMAGHLTQAPNLAILPDSERDVVARALSKRAQDRWPNCRVFVHELAETHAPPRAAVPKSPPPILINSIGMKFAYIPAGRFLMGSPETESERHADEGPQHIVTIRNSFYMGVFPVTQRQFEAIIGYNPSYFKDLAGADEHPVEYVSWHDAVEFCRRLSDCFEERDANRIYHLPTEAEWEYACRAGALTSFAFGDSLSSHQANFNGQHPYGDAPQGPFRQQTTPVTTFAPNAWGLYDMHGNVWEWCADYYDEAYYGSSPEHDPLGARSGLMRVLRGGNWNSAGGKNCRAARRGKDHPSESTPYDGFRVIMIPAASR